MRVMAGLVAALGWIVLSGAPAWAHAVVVRSDPPSGGAVSVSPSALRVTFSQRVESRFTTAQLIDQSGDVVEMGAPQLTSGGRELVLSVPPLDAGTYTVAWEALGSDGHPTTGQYAFQVGGPSAVPPLAAVRRKVVNPNVGLAFGQVRFLWLAAYVALVGSLVFRRLVWDPALRSLEASGSPPDELFIRRVGAGQRLAWLVLAGAGASSLLLEAATASRRGFRASVDLHVIGSMVSTDFGHLWLAQMGLTLLLGPAVVVLARRAKSGPPPRRWLAVGAVVVAGLGTVAVLNGHARSAPRPALAVALAVAHLLAASVWAGGLLAFVAWALPASRAVPAGAEEWPPRGGLVGALVPRFSRLAVVSTAALVLSGFLAARGNLGVLGNLWHLAYGRLLVAKAVLLCGALALGARHLLRTPTALRRAGEAGGRGEGGILASFERSTRAEAGLLAAVLAVTAVLVAVIPGREAQLAAARPVALRHHSEGGDVELFVAPTTTGPNQLQLNFVGGDGVLVPDLAGASAVLRPPRGGGRAVALTSLASGSFAAQITLPSPGAYSLEVRDSSGRVTTFAFKVPRPPRR